MTTLILLTPHPRGLDYDLDQKLSVKNDKVLMSAANPANFS
jgi:hypothetical protein